MTAQAIAVSLAEVLAYRHPGVVRRYAREWEKKTPGSQRVGGVPERRGQSKVKKKRPSLARR